MSTDESTPKGAHEIPAKVSTPILAAETDIVPSSEVVSRFKDAYAILVIGKVARRHVFFGLAAAQKAVERAHARGDFAELMLVRLVPVGGAR